MFSGADLFQYCVVIMFNITSQNIGKLKVLVIKILKYEIKKQVPDFSSLCSKNTQNYLCNQNLATIIILKSRIPQEVTISDFKKCTRSEMLTSLKSRENTLLISRVQDFNIVKLTIKL